MIDNYSSKEKHKVSLCSNSTSLSSANNIPPDEYIRLLNDPDAIERQQSSTTRRIINKDTTGLICNCPGSAPGKINIDISAHQPKCEVRKRVQSKGYVINTSVTPEDFKDGYSLGVAI